jgi:hypothetical protein
MKMSERISFKRPGGMLSFLAVAVLVLVLVWIGIKYEIISFGMEDILRIRIKKMELLSSMRANLLKSVEAEKNAVMADTDESSRAFADESLHSSEAIDRDHREIGLLIKKDYADQEMKLLQEFDGCWAELRRIDQVLLELAVRNTNIKAAHLSFGKGSVAMKRLEEALREMDRTVLSNGRDNRVAELACNALTAGLKIHYLHAPHIAAANDDQMDKIEVDLKQYDDVIKGSLSKLKLLVPQEKQASLREAERAYDELAKVTAEVIDLSRQNTNIKSFELSLGRKRKATARCDEILMSLQEAVKSRTFRATR